MRLPNSYGSIVKLKGKRRKPYMIRKTVGYTDDGQQIRKVIGYAKSRDVAYQILAEYNNDPYDIDLSKVTFSVIFNKWIGIKQQQLQEQKISASSVTSYNNIYKNHLQPLHNEIFVNLRTEKMQECINQINGSYTLKNYAKILCTQLFDYSISTLEMPIKRNYAKDLDIGKKEKSKLHTFFSEEQKNLFWENINVKYMDTILIMIYTGLRPSELLGIEKKNVYLNDKYMVGGIKTDAGIDRIIPLHDRIVPLIEKYMFEDGKWLISHVNGKKMPYRYYLDFVWNKIMNQFNLENKPGDCRHTFATELDNVKANKLCIKIIMGHSIKDITDGVYTHKTIEQLLETVNLLK